MSKSKWLVFLLILSMIIVACSGGTDTPTDDDETDVATTAPVASDEDEEEEAPEPTDEPVASDGKTQVRWFVGLGTGSNEDQIAGQDAVVAAFNESQDEIELVVEYVDNEQATDILNTQIAAGNSPDIIGPVGVAGRAAFTDALLDLRPLIDATNYDLSDFDPAMVDFYELENQGQIGLPFAVFPSFLYYNADLFDEAGLEYPPTEYGAPYILDGEEVPWDMNTVAEIGRYLTVDENGNDATMDDFDADAIVQFGYGVQWTDIRGRLTLFGPGSFHDGSGGAQVPDHWRDAADWYYDAMWGDQPFFPNAVYGGSDMLNAGNWFESGNLAMDHVHLWYATCCTAGLTDNWNIAAMPAALDGSTTAKMHADTFAILEGSDDPDAAFQVLQYLIGEAALDLTQVYGGLPARLSLQDQYFDALDADQFAGRDMDWEVVTASMAYPDNPNHEEGYPNELQARDALATFDEQFNNNPDYDVQSGLDELVDNLNAIFDGAEFTPPAMEEEEEATDDEEAMDDDDAMADGETVTVRWFVGLGTGSNEDQIAGQDAVVEAFNASQDRIELVVEYVDNEQATDILNTQIAAGNSPDIIGPVGVAGRAAFTDALLDLRPLIDATNYDLSDFDPAMVEFYELENQGQIGLPFAVFPSFLYYNADLFDEAGLEYPPTEYGVPYMLDGEEVPWDMNTVAEIGRYLTVDENGNDASMDEFDADAIVQFGYGVQWTDIRGQFTLFGPGSFHDGSGGAQVPDHWRDAADWYYDAMWGDQPFFPNAVYGGSDLLNAGNWFESGNLAMDHVHLWYATCCTAGLEDNWNIAVMPAAPDGSITAKMHADTFAILEGSDNPDAAFEVLQYLIGEAALDLTQVYGGLPARLSLQSVYFDALDADQFAGMDMDWEVVTASMAYPDNPNHEEGYPNELPARDAIAAFAEQFNNNPDYDVQAGLDELQDNLQEVFDE